MSFNNVNQSSINLVAREELESIIAEAHRWCGRDITCTVQSRLREISTTISELAKTEKYHFLKEVETSLFDYRIMICMPMLPNSMFPLKDDRAILKYANKAKEYLAKASQFIQIQKSVEEEARRRRTYMFGMLKTEAFYQRIAMRLIKMDLNGQWA